MKELTCRLFWYLCTPSDPCKNSTKSFWPFQKQYQNCYIGIISITYQPYIYQILPISHLNLEKIWKSSPSPSSSQSSPHFGMWTFWFLALTTPPPLGLFPQFCGIFCLECFPYNADNSFAGKRILIPGSFIWMKYKTTYTEKYVFKYYISI